MPPLSSLLLRRGVTTLAEVEAALARQVVQGGDLATNLLEVATVDESKLVKVVADCEGVRAAKPGVLPVPQSVALNCMHADTAARLQVLPLAVEGETLLLVVAEPLSASVEEELSFSLGLRVEQQLSIRPRIMQAIAEAYRKPLSRRYARVIARLDGHSDPFPSVTPPPPVIGDSLSPPRLSHGPVAARLHTDAGDWQQQNIRVDAPRKPCLVTTNAENIEIDPLRMSDVVATRVTAHAERRRKPFTLVAARNTLEEATSNAAVIGVLFDFAKQFFEYTAIFVVREDLAEGMDAAGPGASRERIRGVGVPLEMPSVLSTARDQRTHILSIPTNEGIDAFLRQDLQRPMNARVLTAPMMVRGRVVALLYGDDGNVDVDLNLVGEVLALTPLVGTALEKLILQRKLAAKKKSSLPPSLEPPREDLKAAKQKTLKGLRAIGSVQVPPLHDKPRPLVAPFLSQQPTPPPSPSFSSPPTTEPFLRIAPQVNKLGHSPAARSVRSDPPAQQVQGETISPMAQSVRLERDDPLSSEADLEPSATTKIGLGPTPELETSPLQISDTTASRPTLISGSDKPESDTPKKKAPSDTGLPQVVFDVDKVVDKLLDGLEAKDTTATERKRIRSELRSYGDAVVPHIINRFPGVTKEKVDLSCSDIPLPTTSGQLLRFVVEMGGSISTQLAELLTNQDPDVRTWAMLVLAEIGGKEGREAVSTLLFDHDASVRHAARGTLQRVVGARAWANGVRTLVRRTAAEHEDRNRRALAVVALGEIREASSVPILIEALRSDDEKVREAAVVGLHNVTRHSLEGSVAAWDSWWKENSGRARFEWLVDALERDDDHQRREAHLELLEIVSEDLGFNPGETKEKQEEAIEAYRRWWDNDDRRIQTIPPAQRRKAKRATGPN